MVFEKNGNIIYLKYVKKNILRNIISIILLIISCIFIFISFNNYSSEYSWMNIFLQHRLTKILLIVGIMIFLCISIFDILFYSNYDYHINIQTNTLHFINGNWKYKNEIILDFADIKNIVLIQTVVDGENGKIYSYQIDIYDNKLNAYEICKNNNYDEIESLSTKIGKILNAEVIDCTQTENYEGYIKRII